MTGGGVLTDVGGSSANYDPANQRFTKEMFKVAFLSAIGGFLFGYDTGIVSGAMIYIRDSIQGQHNPLSDEWQEAIISVTILGAWIFSILAGPSADRWGRRKVVLGASAIFAVGSILMGIAPEKWTLLIGRFVVGAGVGLASMVVPTYIAEMAPAHVRGSLVTTNNLFIAGGQAFAAVTAGIFSVSGIERVSDSLGWRLMLALAAVPAVIQFVGFLFMPESPRWLVRNGYDADARAVLQRIRGPEADVSQEYEDMKASCVDDPEEDNNNLVSSNGSSMNGQRGSSVNGQRGSSMNGQRGSSVNGQRDPVLSGSTSDASKTQPAPDSPTSKFEIEDDVAIESPQKTWLLLEVIQDKYLRKALIVGCMLQIIQQLTGINTVMYYAATIIESSGVYDKSIAVWMASATAILNFIVNIPGIYLVEKVGRRLLTLVSLAGVVASLGFLAIGYHVIESDAPLVTSNTTYGLNSADNSTIDLVKHCMQYSGCSGCISDDTCGYCFDDVVGGDGSCLAGNKKDNYGTSLFDKCANGTIVQEKRVWAFNFCPSKYSWMTLFGLCLYLFFFGPGMGPMPWTINSEIFPLWCRGVCYSTTTSFNWLFNFLVSLTFLSLSKAATKQGAFWIYASFGVIGFVYFYFNLPETKGKSLEDTSRLFGNESRRPSVASRRKSSVARYGSGSHSIHSGSDAHVSGLSSLKGRYNLGLQSD